MSLIRLRLTTEADLDFVLALEHHPDQRPYIGQWSRDEHLRTMARTDREHWMMERADDAARLGYLIAYDVQATGWGVYVKRIAVTDKSRGIGRVALHAFVRHAAGDRGAASVCLAVRHHNARAQRMYAALGFVEVPLDPVARRQVTAEVDAFGDDCLLMHVACDALRPL